MAMDQHQGKVRRVKVVIIGAGIAGIGAGNRLVDEGIDDFVILEASDRVGGRIRSIDLDTDMGHRIELGANWIHGNEHNPIYGIALQNKLLSTQYEGRHLGRKLLFLTETGDPVHPRMVHEVDLSYGLLMSETEEFYKNQVPTPLDGDSVGAFMTREFDDKISRFTGREHKMREMIFDQRLLVECMICGADTMNDIALSEAGCFEDLPGVHYVIPPGFETVIDILKGNIAEGNILLDHKVSRIVWGETTASNDGRVVVECANGAKFCADVVLVTISLGYLKAHAGRMFDPLLPPTKMDAIDRVAMGTVDKVILEFDGQVLPDEVFRLELVWDREKLESEELETRWIKKIAFFEAVADNVLIGWLSGREAEYMETLSVDQIGVACVELLERFLSKTTPTLPSLIKVTRSTWKLNPYTLGSYCHIPVGASAEDILRLGEPVTDQSGKPLLLFAGEATHPTFYSSSHGALLSGRREAQRIRDILLAPPT